VELFVTLEGSLVINEIAPRVHNSGHFTLGGAVTSQFEQHVRAVDLKGQGGLCADRQAALGKIVAVHAR
jgi:5-(carboxyamino)imidazole ribonucleotide synthase